MPVSLPSTLPIAHEVLLIARTLERAGHETWCVGGAIRDNLLGYPNNDYDLATAATPQEVTSLFRRTVPVGIDHGTVAILDRRGGLHEVTTFRRDVHTDGRHAVVEYGVSLDDDLGRRDFTINAIAYHPIRKEWRDPFGGVSDLENGTIRSVGNPERRFEEDFLRILRALRFAARFGFRIEPATWEAGRRQVGGVERLSAERVRDEWFKGLASARLPSELISGWDEIGALHRWLAEVDWPPGDHTVRDAVDALGNTDPLLVTALISGDPAATTSRLRCSNAEIDRARRIGVYRETLPDPASPAHTRRWLADVGGVADDLVAIALARGRGERLSRAVERIREAGDPLTVGDLAVDGSDLLREGVPPGPMVGAVLAILLDEALEDPARNHRRSLLRRALEVIGDGEAAENKAAGGRAGNEEGGTK